VSLAYVALLHHPVYDKSGRIVTAALTNMDVHDIARAACTYGIRRFYVITPVPALRLLAEKIIDHWSRGYGSTYNPSRTEALALVSIQANLDHAIVDVERDAGQKPKLVVTSARPGERRIPFARLRAMLGKERDPFLILLGTGWGLAADVVEQSDYTLEPIRGVGEYNHLSVRCAAAIVLDRLFAGEWWDTKTSWEDFT
jgi:hypothetical protein